ncbi:uncharacterized protein LOC131632510 [Vicia villosa]|uniref:uncharacterized protein LOC131632510 n=1 Tax=Vicia villosa TaxID=3911 RepID=UPI00273BCFE3|nr:uncharacterized protein LOC131632510 [Vicia villosa]
MAQRFDEEGIQVTWDHFRDAFLENYFLEDFHGKKEISKCLKFVNGLGPDIKKVIGYQQITRFAELVNKSRIYDEDIRESGSHYKAMNEKKGQFCGKPYDGKGKQKAGNGKKPSGGGSHTPVKYYRCGVEGHRISECLQSDVTCFK